MAKGQWEGGKGSATRPTDQKKYDENHTRIFGESPLERRVRELKEKEAQEKAK